jgi:hypothetical protein
LALFWNVGQPAPEIAAAFAEVYRSIDTGLLFVPFTTPALDLYAAIFAKAADGIRQAEALSEPEQWRFDWQTTITRDEWLDQAPTAGDHNCILKERLEALLMGMGAVIDDVGGSFTMSYATVAVTAVRPKDSYPPPRSRRANVE